MILMRTRRTIPTTRMTPDYLYDADHRMDEYDYGDAAVYEHCNDHDDGEYEYWNKILPIMPEYK